MTHLVDLFVNLFSYLPFSFFSRYLLILQQSNFCFLSFHHVRQLLLSFFCFLNIISITNDYRSHQLPVTASTSPPRPHLASTTNHSRSQIVTLRYEISQRLRYFAFRSQNESRRPCLMELILRRSRAKELCFGLSINLPIIFLQENIKKITDKIITNHEIKLEQISFSR